MSITRSSFRPAFGLQNRHLQTIWGPLLNFNKVEPERWTEITLDDDDFMELAWFGEQNKPLLIIVHGLEGNYQSHYIQRVLKNALADGFQAVVVHLRGCGRRINRRLESYHSGATGDLDACLKEICQSLLRIPKVAVGFSLGGNVLLKWLGEFPAQKLISAAMAISVPVKLDSCANAINQGFSKLYQKYLIDQLVRKTQIKLKMDLPGPKFNLVGTRWADIKTFWQFDDLVTASLHGFNGVDDYYAKASSFSFLSKIETPSLLLHSIDDPFMEKNMLDELINMPLRGLSVELSERGGHVGFIDRIDAFKGNCFLSNRIKSFFKPYVR